jgi:hypothetical protein
LSAYFVVEGARTEPALLRGWLPTLVPGWVEVDRPDDLRGRCYYIFSVGGSGWADAVRAAAEDWNRFQFQHLIVLVDSEGELPDPVREEVVRVARGAAGGTPVTVAVSHPCVETWLLGNRLFCDVDGDAAYQALRGWHDVVQEDPEAMEFPGPILDGSLPSARMTSSRRSAAVRALQAGSRRSWTWRTAAQFHMEYLREAFLANGGLRYRKNDPGPGTSPEFLAQLQSRVREGHIRSMAPLLRWAEHVSAYDDQPR